MKKIIFSIPLFWLFLTCVSNVGTDTSHESMGGTNDETIVRTGAIIYEQDGTTPAKGASVKVFKTDATNGVYVTMKITDNYGRFFLQDLEPGMFNIWVEKDSMVAFQDSICISTSGTTLHNDTLDCPSSLTGFTSLHPLYDPRSVTIQVIGTDKYLNHIDSTGHFTLKGMAGGTYSLLLKSNFPDYTPATYLVNVNNCTNDTLKDTIRLVDSGMISWITILHAGSDGTLREKSSLNRIQLHSSIYGSSCNTVNHSLQSDMILRRNLLTSMITESQSSP